LKRDDFLLARACNRVVVGHEDKDSDAINAMVALFGTPPPLLATAATAAADLPRPPRRLDGPRHRRSERRPPDLERFDPFLRRPCPPPLTDTGATLLRENANSTNIIQGLLRNHRLWLRSSPELGGFVVDVFRALRKPLEPGSPEVVERNLSLARRALKIICGLQVPSCVASPPRPLPLRRLALALALALARS
jgi:hypothetical protein